MNNSSSGARRRTSVKIEHELKLELTSAEYACGLARVESRVRLERPAVVCFVGLDGWRRAGHPRARPGWIEGGFAGRRAYLMPSTSGRNAHTNADELARHLRRAARG